MRMMYHALENFDETEQRVRSLDFDERANIVDEVTYPGIAILPDDIRADFHRVLRQFHPGLTVTINHAFARLSVEGVNPPHKVHNDLSMGTNTCLLYLCGEGGTFFLTHREYGFSSQPETDEELEAWKRDTGNEDQWHVDLFVPAERNKCVVFPAEWMHAASDGYGDKQDGRLVMIAFYDLKEPSA